MIAGQLLPFPPNRAMQDFASDGSDPRPLRSNLTRPGHVTAMKRPVAARLSLPDTRGYNLPFRHFEASCGTISRLLAGLPSPP
jgi:hypothetical protein